MVRNNYSINDGGVVPAYEHTKRYILTEIINLRDTFMDYKKHKELTGTQDPEITARLWGEISNLFIIFQEWRSTKQLENYEKYKEIIWDFLTEAKKPNHKGMIEFYKFINLAYAKSGISDLEGEEKSFKQLLNEERR